MVSAVVFLPTCNFRCPFCYNKSLVLQSEALETVSDEMIKGHLKLNRRWIDGVVVTGGEPTIHASLPLLCQEMKEMGFRVKLDTNGTNPAALRELIDSHLIDYVALDIKAPFTVEKYSEACGIREGVSIRKIRESVDLLMGGTVEYEFRTTVVPTLHDVKDIERICQAVRNCKRYALQNFKSGVDTIDPRFQDLRPFSKAQMESFLKVAQRSVLNAVVRG